MVTYRLRYAVHYCAFIWCFLVNQSSKAFKNAASQTPAIEQEDISRTNPPNSNTGGKEERKNKAIQNWKEQTGLIDYLTIVIPDTDFKPADKSEYDHDLFVDAVNKYFMSNLNLLVHPKIRGGKNFYSDSHDITDKAFNNVGFVAHGGNKDTVCISISGAGTKFIGSAGFRFIRDWLVRSGGHISRIDIAHDCFNGEKTIEDALHWYKSGVFRSGKNGTKPCAKYLDDFGSGSGRTLYVGNRKSGKLFRVYEKGKQLGDVSSLWTRFELELRSTDRVISPDILIFSGDYLSGSYECLDWISAKQSHVKTQSKTAKVTFAHLQKHCKQAYGRFLNVMFAVYDTPEEIINNIIRDDGFPRRLSMMKETARD